MVAERNEPCTRTRTSTCVGILVECGPGESLVLNENKLLRRITNHTTTKENRGVPD